MSSVKTDVNPSLVERPLFQNLRDFRAEFQGQYVLQTKPPSKHALRVAAKQMEWMPIRPAPSPQMEPT